MQISVEAPTKIQRRITVIVPIEKVDQAYDQRIAKISKTVKLNGFRPGKIPLEVVKQRFGDSARQEALSEIIQKSLYSALDQNKLNPVSVPMVEPTNILPGQPLEFSATFEVLPEIDHVTFNVTEVEKEVAQITEEDITRVIERLQKQHTIWNPVDRAAEVNDQIIIDFRGMIDGVVFAGGEAHDYPIVLGSKVMVPGFEEGLIGLKQGEQKTITVTFDENYFAKEVAGKPADFFINVIKVMEPKLPEINKEFVKKLGIKEGDIEILRAEIRKNLERELSVLIKSKLKGKVFDKLLEQNPLEIPKALIEREAKRIHDEMHPHHKDHDHGHTDEEMAVFNESAIRNVALGLLVGELIKKNQLTLDSERLQALIDTISSNYEKPADVKKWYVNNKKAKAQLEMQVLEEQVVEKLLEEVTVREKIVSYNEIIANPVAAPMEG